MTPDRLAEIAEREREAFPGPWIHDYGRHGGDENGGWSEWWYVANKEYQANIVAESTVDMVTAKFIAHAREDIPELLAYVRQLEDRAAALTEENQHLRERLLTLGGDARRRE